MKVYFEFSCCVVLVSRVWKNIYLAKRFVIINSAVLTIYVFGSCFSALAVILVSEFLSFVVKSK